MIEALQKKVDDISGQMESVSQKMKPLQSRFTRLLKMREQALDDLAKAKIEAMGKEPDFKLLLDRSVHTSGPIYNEARKVFNEMGFDSTGYWTDTLQASLRIHLKKDAPVDVLAVSIRKILPAMKAKRFGILSNDLSASGVLRLDVDEDGASATLIKTTYGRDNTLFRGTLEQVLKRIAYYHWYGEPHQDDEDWRM